MKLFLMKEEVVNTVVENTPVLWIEREAEKTRLAERSQKSTSNKVGFDV